MTQQHKDELNKQLCGLLGICWHHFMEKEYRCTHCDAPDYEKNPDFTSEAGRVQLLKLMMKIKNYENFGDLWFLFACWDDKENKVYAVPTKYLTNDNGAFARAAREFLKAMEVKE